MKLVAILCASLVLMGCVSNSGRMPHRIKDPAEVPLLSEVKFDQFNRQYTVSGPTQSFGRHSAFLRGFKTADGTELFQVYMWARMNDWAFFREAYLHGGEKLPFTEIDTSVEGPGVVEHVAAELTRDQIANSTLGISIKFFGKRNSRSIRLNHAYAKGFLTAFDLYTR